MVEGLILNRTKSLVETKTHSGMESYYLQKIEEMETKITEKQNNLRRLEA